MLLTKIIESEWSRVIDWRAMRASTTYEDPKHNEYTEADFDNFVEILFRNFAEIVGIKYKYVRDILYGRNIEFFRYKTQVFNEYDTIDISMDEFDELTKKLYLPYFFANCNTVDAFFSSFDELSIQDKIDIMEKLSRATILVPNRNNGELSKTFLTQFSELSQADKCRVIQSLFETEVKINVEVKR